jgi:DNA-binding CsgD family transcriptional regulator
MQELSATELRVLQLAAEGMTLAETAEELEKSPNTINNQRDTIRKKLDANNLTHAVAIALREEIIE